MIRVWPGDLAVSAEAVRAEFGVAEMLGADLDAAGELRLPVAVEPLRWFVEVALPLLAAVPGRDPRVRRPLAAEGDLQANVEAPWQPLARAVSALHPDALAAVARFLSYVGNPAVEELCAASFAHRARAADAVALSGLLRPWRAATGPAPEPVSVEWMFKV